MQIVDAYTHCGLSRYEPIETVRRTMDSAGVERAVLVQHMGEFDNSYIGQVVADDPLHLAGVCLVNHESPTCVDDLRGLKAGGHFSGVRLTTGVLSGTPHLFKAAAQLDMTIVLYAERGIAAHVDILAAFLDRHPQACIVLTHLGLPEIADGPQFEAYQRVFELAQFPEVYYQISGMKMLCPYPHKPLHGLIEQAVEHFSPDRLCWGSNYPVVGDEQDYQRNLHLLLDGRLPVPADAIPAIAGRTAHRLWFEEQDGAS